MNKKKRLLTLRDTSVEESKANVATRFFIYFNY
jgi:hypothetical protein